MDPLFVVFVILGYFLVLILISIKTSGKQDAEAFFTGNRQSPWYVVAFGMIGASLSGVTFISVPGWVADSQFTYMQMVFGFLLGYLVIATVLMPLYYRLKLITIYSYLHQRFGIRAYKTGSFFFLLSRVIGASFRLFLVAGVLQLAVFDAWNVPFWVSVMVTIILIWVYTFRGGIKTIVWTDTLQTFFMLASVITIIIYIANEFDWGFMEMSRQVMDSEYSQMFVWDWKPETNFFKQFFSGAFIAIVMTGLDQDMMQKNLTCKNIFEAKKNMLWFSVSLIFANLLFLTVGVLLYLYADANAIGLPDRSDDVFPFLALNHIPPYLGIIFLLGITAAAYSSADSALTSLTTAFCVDFLGFRPGEKEDKKVRIKTHIGFSVLLFIVIMIFYYINDESVISTLYTVSGYTYGPLLGLFAFGLFSKRQANDKLIPYIALLSPVLSYGIKLGVPVIFDGYEIGFEILIINGILMFLGILFVSKPGPRVPAPTLDPKKPD